MPITVTPIKPVIGATITGVDVTKDVDDATFAAIRAALEAHGVLVLPDQPMTDDAQVAFSERFGPLEISMTVNPGQGTPFARQSNLDIRSGETIPTEDRRMAYQKANMMWHADSTFKQTPSLCSLLSAREVPPEGGATEFASTRGAYESLSEDMKAEVADLIVEHDFIYSRGLTGFTLTPEEAAQYAVARHRLVVTSPESGRKGLMIGAHARSIAGWPEDRGRALLDDLLARATRPENTFRHQWTEGDLVIWDNRNVVHRATPFDSARHRRLMQRTTVSTGVASPY